MVRLRPGCVLTRPWTASYSALRSASVRQSMALANSLSRACDWGPNSPVENFRTWTLSCR